MDTGAGERALAWPDPYCAQGVRWRKWLGRAVAAVLVLDVCGFLILGANRPANPHLVPPTSQAARGGSLPGRPPL